LPGRFKNPENQRVKKKKRKMKDKLKDSYWNDKNGL
jgi:hypothetical protein